jgi:hypothetical protein
MVRGLSYRPNHSKGLAAAGLFAVHKRKRRREDMTVEEPVKEEPRWQTAVDGPVMLEGVEHQRLELIAELSTFGLACHAAEV